MIGKTVSHYRILDELGVEELQLRSAGENSQLTRQLHQDTLRSGFVARRPAIRRAPQGMGYCDAEIIDRAFRSGLA